VNIQIRARKRPNKPWDAFENGDDSALIADGRFRFRAPPLTDASRDADFFTLCQHNSALRGQSTRLNSGFCLNKRSPALFATMPDFGVSRTLHSKAVDL
jgi:hypothetical protein